MKSILASALLLTSVSAFADWSQKNEKELNDLMYLPAAKTISGTTSIVFVSTDLELLTTAGTSYSKVKGNGTILNQELGYSISDNEMISVSLAQLLSDKVTYSYGAGSTAANTTADYKAEGFTDPSIGLKSRLLHQTDKKMDLDFLVSFSPKMGNKKAASTTVKGNAYRGNYLINAGLDLGNKFSDKSWKLSVGLNSYGKGQSVDQANTREITETAARTDIDVNFSWQWVFNPTFTLNLHTGLGVNAEESTVNTVGDVRSVTDATNSFLIGTDCIFNIDKKFAIDLALGGQSYSEGNLKQTTISSGAVTTLKIKDYAVGVFSVSAKYEF